VSWNRILVVEAMMSFLMCKKTIWVVKTFAADDCSGAGSRCDSIRAVIPVIAFTAIILIVHMNIKSSIELMTDAYDVLLCDLMSRCKARSECPSRC